MISTPPVSLFLRQFEPQVSFKGVPYKKTYSMRIKQRRDVYY